MMLNLVAAFLIQSAPAYPVGEIGERLAKPPTCILDSAKTPDRLELCIADVVSNDLTAAAFRDGPDRTVVVGSLNFQFHSGVPVAIELLRTATGTRVIARMGKANARFQAGIQRCL